MRMFCIAILIVLVACNSNSGSKKELENKQPAIDTLKAAKPTKKFSDIQFASKYDTSCGMPISAGLEDTLIFKGKVYGFCSAECKAEFVKVLKTQHKR